MGCYTQIEMTVRTKRPLSLTEYQELIGLIDFQGKIEMDRDRQELTIDIFVNNRSKEIRAFWKKLSAWSLPALDNTPVELGTFDSDTFNTDVHNATVYRVGDQFRIMYCYDNATPERWFVSGEKIRFLETALWWEEERHVLFDRTEKIIQEDEVLHGYSCD